MKRRAVTRLCDSQHRVRQRRDGAARDERDEDRSRQAHAADHDSIGGTTGRGGSYRLATSSSFSTPNVNGTSRARKLAAVRSDSESTTPSSIVRPRCTTM